MVVRLEILNATLAELHRPSEQLAVNSPFYFMYGKKAH